MSLPAPAPAKRYSPEEYLRLEADAKEKHEFHAGEILAMSGGTYRHGRIIMNAAVVASNRLRGSNCFVLGSDVKVRLEATDRYVYPDVTIVCGGPQFDPHDPNETTITNPKVIIEVLSDSTEAYDRGVKFGAYRDLSSLRGYVLIAQNTPSIEIYTRQPDGTWLFDAVHGIEATARIASVQIEVPLAEVYAGLTFTPAGTEQAKSHG
jgi:Uma2 family endonuclease